MERRPRRRPASSATGGSSAARCSKISLRDSFCCDSSFHRNAPKTSPAAASPNQALRVSAEEQAEGAGRERCQRPPAPRRRFSRKGDSRIEGNQEEEEPSRTTDGRGTARSGRPAPCRRRVCRFLPSRREAARQTARPSRSAAAPSRGPAQGRSPPSSAALPFLPPPPRASPGSGRPTPAPTGAALTSQNSGLPPKLTHFCQTIRCVVMPLPLRGCDHSSQVVVYTQYNTKARNQMGFLLQ